jgi:hypothetical protein
VNNVRRAPIKPVTSVTRRIGDHNFPLSYREKLKIARHMSYVAAVASKWASDLLVDELESPEMTRSDLKLFAHEIRQTLDKCDKDPNT